MVSARRVNPPAVKILSAISFTGAGAVGGLLGELWRLNHGGPPADLGVEGSVVGLALFGVLFAAMISW